MYLLNFQYTGLGCWVINNEYLLFIIILSLEYRSSGENLAGWADNVGLPFGSSFFRV